MKQARILREKERLFAIRYGTEQPPNPLDGEDLQSNDLADAEHCVQVYRAVVGLTHGVRGSACDETLRDGAQAQGPTQARRTMRLVTKVHELHLAFWTDRLNRFLPSPVLGDGLESDLTVRRLMGGRD